MHDAAATPAVRVPAAIWPAVCLFRALETQWRIAVGFGVSAWLGLDYPAADVLMRRTPAFAAVDFADLQVMEAEALIILNKEG